LGASRTPILNVPEPSALGNDLMTSSIPFEVVPVAGE
jgi:hypothetical protein